MKKNELVPRSLDGEIKRAPTETGDDTCRWMGAPQKRCRYASGADRERPRAEHGGRATDTLSLRDKTRRRTTMPSRSPNERRCLINRSTGMNGKSPLFRPYRGKGGRGRWVWRGIRIAFHGTLGRSETPPFRNPPPTIVLRPLACRFGGFRQSIDCQIFFTLSPQPGFRSTICPSRLTISPAGSRLESFARRKSKSKAPFFGFINQLIKTGIRMLAEPTNVTYNRLHLKANINNLQSRNVFFFFKNCLN